jgi:hypothetical protein
LQYDSSIAGCGAAVASFLSDLRKWQGGMMYEGHMLEFLSKLGLMEAMRGSAGVKHWIEGFN